MRFDGDVLTIDLSMSMDEIREFEQFIRPRIEYVETIEVEEGNGLVSGALVALLASLKRTRSDLMIPYLDKGIVTSQTYGTLHWMCHD